jgi:dipeptidyl aminopeptidase/acylaminoacyl peptidase
MPPTLIIHGDADLLVPIQQSQRILAKIAEFDVPNKLEVRHGKGHGWPGMEKDGELLADWFEKYLK